MKVFDTQQRETPLHVIIDTDLADPNEATEIANVLTSYAKQNKDEDSDLVINLYTKRSGVKKFYASEHKTPSKLKSAIKTELKTLVHDHDGVVRAKRDLNDWLKNIQPNFGSAGNTNYPVVSFTNPGRITMGTDYSRSPTQSCSKRTTFENNRQVYYVNDRQVSKYDFDRSCSVGYTIPIGLIY